MLNMMLNCSLTVSFYEYLKWRAKGTDLGSGFTWGAVQDLLIPTHLSSKKTHCGSLISNCYTDLLPRKLYLFWYPKPELDQKWKQKGSSKTNSPVFSCAIISAGPLYWQVSLFHAIMHTLSRKQQAGHSQDGVEPAKATTHHFQRRGEPLGVSIRCGGSWRPGGCAVHHSGCQHAVTRTHTAVLNYLLNVSMLLFFITCLWILHNKCELIQGSKCNDGPCYLAQFRYETSFSCLASYQRTFMNKGKGPRHGVNLTQYSFCHFLALGLGSSHSQAWTPFL